jgi:hypothetical protein
MISYKEFLQEKYFNSFKVSQYGRSRVYDVFTNPSSKEVKELKTEEGGAGVRYVIDFKEKKLYMWHASAIHGEMFDFLKIKMSKMMSEYGDRYLAVSEDAGTRAPESHITLYSMVSNKQEIVQEFYNQLDSKSWVGKHADVKALRKMLVDIAKYSGFELDES